MKFNRASFLNTHRDAWVEVNLDCIEHNILEFKKYLKKDAKLFAVVKADAYGHGAVMIAPVLLASGVDFLGVSSVDEGLQLRENDITAPILVLALCRCGLLIEQLRIIFLFQSFRMNT